MFGSVKSANKEEVDFDQFSKAGEEKRESLDSQVPLPKPDNKKEDVNFSMFGSVKSDKSKASGTSSKAEPAMEKKDVAQHHEKAEPELKESVGFSMFGSVKSNGSGLSESKVKNDSFNFDEFASKVRG